ncbi:hypothetical protein [Corynebacterium matruchotii]|uniref:hypothetical protein n=1 Tax=Corynebacterium matruchotii TaxID=43768 RepID=UPI001FC90B36|nr:hypothetical protein [Corynebacterium matruchotii]
MNTPRRNYHLERLTNLTFAFLNAAQNLQRRTHPRLHTHPHHRLHQRQPRQPPIPEATYKLVYRDLGSLIRAGVPLEM